MGAEWKGRKAGVVGGEGCDRDWRWTVRVYDGRLERGGRIWPDGA